MPITCTLNTFVLLYYYIYNSLGQSLFSKYSFFLGFCSFCMNKCFPILCHALKLAWCPDLTVLSCIYCSYVFEPFYYFSFIISLISIRSLTSYLRQAPHRLNSQRGSGAVTLECPPEPQSWMISLAKLEC